MKGMCGEGIYEGGMCWGRNMWERDVWGGEGREGKGIKLMFFRQWLIQRATPLTSCGPSSPANRKYYQEISKKNKH